MGTLIAGLDSLTLHEPIFKDVKYYLSGEVPEKITELLRAGGGEQTKYFSDFVSHLICGFNAPETDLTDANDLYEIPAATFHWVIACVKQKKIVSVKPYDPSRNQLFSGVVACISQVTPRDAKNLFALISYYGGRAKLTLDSKCTHLISGTVTGAKYSHAVSAHDKLKVVTPDWVTESVKAKVQCAHDAYHPKLLKPPPAPSYAPPPNPQPDSRIGSITGFDFEEGIAKSEVPTQSMADNNKDLESTQALLDKLKQRMPWNHPATAPVSSGNINPVASVPAPVVSGLPTTLPNPMNLLPKTLPNPPIVQQHSIQQPVPPQNQNIQGQPSHLTMTNILQHLNPANSPQGLSAIQIQQQRMMQQHHLRMRMQSKVAVQMPARPAGLNQPEHILQQNQVLQHQQNQLPVVSQQHQLNNPNQGQVLHQQKITGLGLVQQIVMNQKNQTHAGILNQQQPQQAVISNQNQPPTQTMQGGQQQSHNLSQMPLHQQQVQPIRGPLLNQQQQAGVQQIHVMNQQPTQNLNISRQQSIVGNQPQQMTQAMAVQNQPNLPVSQQNQMHGLNQQGAGVPLQQTWRQQPHAQHQQNLQLIQNAPQNAMSNQQQAIRGAMLQQRIQMPQSQMILQQQIVQNQNILNDQSPGQNLQQANGQQPQTIQQVAGQKPVGQQLNAGPQQILINQQQHQQILVQGNQHIALQGNRQMANQGGKPQMLTQGGQMISQGQQIVTQGGQQILTQAGQQILTQSGQQILTQGGQQILTQSGQQILTQGGQQIISQGQQILNQAGQQILSQNRQSVSPAGQQILNQGNQQGGQQILAQGQQIIQQGQGQGQVISHQGGQQMITWQQQQFLQQRQQQIITGQPGAVAQRVSWGAGTGGRQLIHLDAQTHAQLQQMDPQQRAQFVAQLQKRRQLSAMRAAAQQQQGGAAQGVTFVRGQLPPGLNAQQQVQWLQQQQQGVRMVAPSPANTNTNVNLNVEGTQSASQQQQQQQRQYAQLQLQRQQQNQQLQHLQAQREAAHKQAQLLASGVASGGVTTVVAGRTLPDAVPPSPEAGVVTQIPPTDQVGGVIQGGGAPPLVVNSSRTKTALANMLSNRLQGAQPSPMQTDVSEQPSAAGTLRLMTAAHNAPPRTPSEVVQSLQQRRPPQALHHQLPVSPHSHQQQPLPYNCANPNSMAIPAKVGVANSGVAARVPVIPSPVTPQPRIQFYGHNPNLKLPPDLFLLGCIFHVVEYGDEATKWTEVVGKHGGEVEPGYCARVTHVLAQTQKHGVVMQALRDSKRCVTAYWLSDTMCRRQVMPPWQALHLPLMFAAHDTPAAKHRASLTGFGGEERHRVKYMLQHTGAKVTHYMTRDNTVLICKRPEGTKYQKAKDWGIPAVSAQWITDLLLGNMSALTQIEHTKYQQFNVANPFRMDYTLVPHLMNAWKMPINITQESHERVKRGALMTPRKAKRPRLAPPNNNITMPAMLNAPPVQVLPNAPRVLFSYIKDTATYGNIVRKLGGLVVTHATEATHLVMSQLVRTPKLIAALITIRHAVSVDWVTESANMSAFADENRFQLNDKTFEETYNCDIPRIIAMGNDRRKLFESITFYMTPCVTPSRSSLTEMIELCGGKVDKNRKSFVAIQEMHKERPNSYLVLTVPNDLHLVYYLLQAEKNLNIVCNTELVLSSIMQQKLEVEHYLVKMN